MVLVFLLLLAGLAAPLPASAQPADSVFSSPRNYLLSWPRLLWTGLVQPLGAFTVYAERTELPRRAADWFTNAERTFGVFPWVQLGGETGSGGGLRSFHSDLFGRGKQFEGFGIFSRPNRRQFQALYRDPALGGGPWQWELGANLLHTDSEDATINGEAEESEVFRLRLEQFDLRAALGWQSNAGPLAEYTRGLSLEASAGYGRRELAQVEGLSLEGDRFHGLGRALSLGWVGGRLAYDSRDYAPPQGALSHPLNYQFPGRILRREGELYHSFRNLSYPEGGGLLLVGGEVAWGEERTRFARLEAEAQRFFTLFWRERILALRARLDRVVALDSGRIPFADLPALGGSQRLRGYHRGSLRGEGALLLSAEYRYPIWDTWNAFLFWDEGQVFDEYGQVALDRFRTAYGAGVALRTSQALILSLRVGHSNREPALAGFSLEQEF
jgi:hypothetical protein